MQKVEKPLVLVVNPDRKQLNSIKSCLITEEYTVYTAETSSEALLYMKENPAGILISDENVADSGGIEFLRTVRNKYPNTIRCIIGKDVSPDSVVQSELHKPWAEQELLEKIKDCTDFFLTKEANRESMKRILSASQEMNRPRKEDLLLSTALLNVLPHAAVVVDSDFDVVISNDIYNFKIAAELNGRNLPEDLKQQLQDRAKQAWTDFRIPYRINSTVYFIRVRPLRETDSNKAILFFDPEFREKS